MGAPTPTSVLTVLTQARLGEVACNLGVRIPRSGRKDVQVARLLDAARLPLPALLGHLYRDELRAACREHGLMAKSRSRDELAGRLLDAAGLPRARDTIPSLFATTTSGDTPKASDVVIAVRRRNYLVDQVPPPISAEDTTRVALNNVELGVLICDAAFAARVSRQWHSLVTRGPSRCHDSNAGAAP